MASILTHAEHAAHDRNASLGAANLPPISAAGPALDEAPGINHSLNMYRIIGADGREYGPISADLLRQWIAENRANANTRVIVEASTDWKSLGSLPEFSALLSTKAISVAPAPFPTSTVSVPKTNGFATTGMVLGIVSLTIGFCCCYGMPFNILGLIFSVIALVQINNNPERYTGSGSAITGVVLCVISLFISLIFLIIISGSGGWDRLTHHAYRL